MTYEVGASGNLIPPTDQENISFIDDVFSFPIDRLFSPISSKDLGTASLDPQPETNPLGNVIKESSKTAPVKDIEELNNDENVLTSTPKQSYYLSNDRFPSATEIYKLTVSNSDDRTFATVNDKTPCKSCGNSDVSKIIPKALNLTTPFKNALFFPKVETTTNKRVSKKITPTVAISDEFMEYQRRIEEKKAEEEEKRINRKEKMQKSKIEREKKQANPKRKSVTAKTKPKKLSAEKHISKAVKISRNETSSSESESDKIISKRRNANKEKTKNLVHFDDNLKSNDVPNTSSDFEESQCTLHLPTPSTSYKRYIYESGSESDNIF